MAGAPARDPRNRTRGGGVEGRGATPSSVPSIGTEVSPQTLAAIARYAAPTVGGMVGGPVGAGAGLGVSQLVQRWARQPQNLPSGYSPTSPTAPVYGAGLGTEGFNESYEDWLNRTRAGVPGGAK